MKTVKIIWKTVQIALLVLLSAVLVSNLYIIGAKTLFKVENPTVFGFTWAVVVTGSMEPEISGNDLIITQKQKEYNGGDIIMFQTDMLITHRIIGKTAEGFITKGDANNTEDAVPVPQEKIVGKVIAVIPKIGVFFGYLKTPLGMGCVTVLGLLLIEIPYWIEERKKEREERSE